MPIHNKNESADNAAIEAALAAGNIEKVKEGASIKDALDAITAENAAECRQEAYHDARYGGASVSEALDEGNQAAERVYKHRNH